MANRQFKSLIIKKFGWKRVAKNTMRFGWILDDAVEHVDTTVTTNYEGRIVGNTIYIDEHKQESSKVRIHLDFYRDKNRYVNLRSIFLLELFYNIFFYARRLIGFCLPILFAIIFIFLIFSSSTPYNSQEEPIQTILTYLIIGFFLWLGLIVLEGILAVSASKILKIKPNKT